MPLAIALRNALKGYNFEAFQSDLFAGLVTGVLWLPFAIALGISAGLQPNESPLIGAYSAAIAGFLVPLLGGSSLQITGPSAALLVALVPVIYRHGVVGIAATCVLAGLMLIAMGVAKLGRFIQFIPYPVTRGFAFGIAILFMVLQLPALAGITTPMRESLFENFETLWVHRSQIVFGDVSVGVITVLVLIMLSRTRSRVAWTLLALAGVTLICALLHRILPVFHVTTIGQKFSALSADAIARRPTIPTGVAWHTIRLQALSNIATSAFAVAMLAAIESLLTAVIADGMSQKKHDPDGELVGLGIGNVVVGALGGLPATGSLTMTVGHIKNGARTPIAGAISGITVFIAVLWLAPLVSHVPVSVIAAFLIIVAWVACDFSTLARLLRIAPKSDVAVWATCFFLTLFFHMILAIAVGVVLASLLFMRRMSELSRVRLSLPPPSPIELPKLPREMVLYQLRGPLCFGVASQALAIIENLHRECKVVILDFDHVPVIDVTGFVALEQAIERLGRAKITVILSGQLPEPRRVIDNETFRQQHDNVYFSDAIDEAIPLGLGFIEVAASN